MPATSSGPMPASGSSSSRTRRRSRQRHRDFQRAPLAVRKRARRQFGTRGERGGGERSARRRAPRRVAIPRALRHSPGSPPACACAARRQFSKALKRGEDVGLLKGAGDAATRNAIGAPPRDVVAAQTNRPGARRPSSPDSRLTSVDLPAPLGPMTAWISPRASASETPSTATSPPKRAAEVVRSQQHLIHPIRPRDAHAGVATAAPIRRDPAESTSTATMMKVPIRSCQCR